MKPLLEIPDLSVSFDTDEGVVRALDGVTLTVSGYTAFYCRAEEEIQYTEDRDGTVIYHRGHYYRVRIDA